MTGPYANHIEEYRAAINSGKVTVGKWIRLLYERVHSDLQAGEYFFDNGKANRAIEFIENFCHHCEGRNDLLKLELWQKAAVGLMFGIVDESGYRIYREVFIVVARKNGKSIFASACIAYMAYLDGEYGAKIYCLAPKLEQAAIVYENFYRMVQAEPEMAELAQKRRSDVYIGETNTSVRPLAFNAKKSDGYNPHLAVCDEIASWPAEQGLKQYQVMKSALGARRQPMMLSITTAGYVNDGIYDELMMRATAFLQGSSKERRLLPILYIIDDINKWDDLTELRKSNPNMGVSVSEEFYLEEIEIARNSMPKKMEFLCKYCNIKQNSAAAWLPFEVVDAVSGEEYTLEDFRGCYCVGGIDLSQTTDLTACSVVIERNGKLYVFTQFFMPANKIDELQKREGVPYRIYVQQGWITPSGDNYVDYRDCFAWFRKLIKDYKILPLRVGYDRYSSQYLVQEMTAAGFKMSDVYQGWNLSPILLETEGLIRDGNLRIGKNNLLKAHFLNVALQQNDENRKYQAVKIEQRLHIDGFVSVADALTVRAHDYEEIGQRLKNLKAG